jgi:hypothetical protein
MLLHKKQNTIKTYIFFLVLFKDLEGLVYSEDVVSLLDK